MPDGETLPILGHELADDELQWMKSVYAEFSKARAPVDVLQVHLRTELLHQVFG